MKEKTDWCECGLTYEKTRHASVQLDNTCAMFKPLDLLNLDEWDWHPVAVKKAAAKAKDCKSNVTGQRTRHLVAGTLDPIVGFPFY